jgi:hypothetical protein
MADQTNIPAPKQRKKMGRPLIEIDWNVFEALCFCRCTLREISLYFKASEDTIERAVKREQKLSFAEYYAQKSAKGDVSLRRKQFEVALKGNPAMLIWLGKNRLGQADKAEISGPGGKPIPHEVETLDRGQLERDLNNFLAGFSVAAGEHDAEATGVSSAENSSAPEAAR